jgi:hypothetical protein
VGADDVAVSRVVLHIAVDGLRDRRSGSDELLAAADLPGEGIPAGNHVPRATPAGQVIQRSELARDLVGLVERGVDSAGKPDPLGHRGQGREHRERVRSAHDIQVVDFPALLAQAQPFRQEKKSNLPRSAVCATWRKVENSIWLPAAGSLHTVWLLTPGTPAAKWICLVGLLIRLLPGRATSVRLVIAY